jgi:hypothetical protein
MGIEDDRLRTEDDLILRAIEQSQGGVIPTWIELSRHEANQLTPEQVDKLSLELLRCLGGATVGVYIFPEKPQKPRLYPTPNPFAGIIVVVPGERPPDKSENIIVLYESNDGKNKIRYIPKEQIVDGLKNLVGSLSGGKRIIPLVDYNPLDPKRD